MYTTLEEEPKKFTIALGNATGKLNIEQINRTVILYYPCEDQTICTNYDVSLPSGTYMFETWGAQGGFSGGKGGYSRGIIHFPTKQKIHIFIGAHGNEKVNETGEIEPSFNGGGRGYCAHSEEKPRSAGSGGGATDIRINGVTLYNRVIVSGAGGGNVFINGKVLKGGSGGGISGNISEAYNSQGGNQTSPGIGVYKIGSEFVAYGTASGDFGRGGYFTKTESSIGGTYGGGGSGWYGGACGMIGYDSGAGGSGYILTSFSYKPKNYKFSSRYFFSYPVLIDGDSEMPKCEGTFNPHNVETGHSGNGCVRITQIIELTEYITCAAKRNPHMKSETYLCIYAMTLIFNHDK